MTSTGKTRKSPRGREQEQDITPRILVLHNDDFNTFPHVISSLIEVCGHDELQAEQCALITHLRGSCDIKTGPTLLLEVLRDLLEEKHLTVTIED